MADFNDTENDILNSMLGESGNDDTVDGGNDETKVTETQSTETTPAASTGEAKPPVRTDSKVDKVDGTKPKAESQDPTVISPVRGDLVDPKTGQIIARAGSQRRAYEKEATLNYHTARNELAVYKQKDDFIREHNMQPKDVLNAVHFASLYAKDPAKALNILLTNARERGINIEGMSGSVDSNAIINQVKELLKPITSKHEESAQQEQYRNQAQTMLEEFYESNPNASLHEDTINAVLIAAEQRGLDLSLGDAWSEVRVWAAKKGLDLSKPLQEQLEAQSVQTQTLQSDKQTKSIPQSRASSNSTTTMSKPANETVYANPNDSWADITRQCMEEAKAAGHKF